jgi:hypothetical protein
MLFARKKILRAVAERHSEKKLTRYERIIH